MTAYEQIILAVVIIVGILVFALFVSLLLDLELDLFAKAKRKVVPLKKSTVKVAYKKGIMLPGNGHFKGVMGGGYGPDDDRNPGSLGFHAYGDLNQALDHPQEGNVLLEVLLSGVVEEMEDGYVAEHQRVLQIIPYRCDDSNCQLLPTHFAYMKGQELSFVCSLHAAPVKALHKTARVVSAIPFVRPLRPFMVEPISKLPACFPWMNENKIVVGKLKGKDKFIPTVIKSEVLS